MVPLKRALNVLSKCIYWSSISAFRKKLKIISYFQWFLHNLSRFTPKILNAPTARVQTWLKMFLISCSLRKTRSAKFPLGGGTNVFLARGLFPQFCILRPFNFLAIRVKFYSFLYARLVGTYYDMARASVRPPPPPLSVCLSVRLSVHKACKHDTDWTVAARTLKLGTHTTYDKRTNPIDFQGQGSKVKVTSYTLLLNLVNTIQTEPFKLGSSKFVRILLMTRGRHLLIFNVRGQRSRSHAPHYCKTL